LLSLSLKPRNIGFAGVDDLLDHLNHPRIMREGHDLPQLIDPSAHVGNQLFHARAAIALPSREAKLTGIKLLTAFAPSRWSNSPLEPRP
jgi:hypothetical protein